MAKDNTSVNITLPFSMVYRIKQMVSMGEISSISGVIHMALQDFLPRNPTYAKLLELEVAQMRKKRGKVRE